MKQIVIYVHGKGGTAEEARHYQPLFAESDVIGFDYKSQNPWEAKREFSEITRLSGTFLPAFYMGQMTI